MVMAADELNKQLQLDKNTALSKDKPGKTLKVVFSISRYDKGKVNSGLRKKRGYFMLVVLTQVRCCNITHASFKLALCCGAIVGSLTF